MDTSIDSMVHTGMGFWMHVFETLDQVREETAKCVLDNNHYRPHYALGGMSPVAYRLAKGLKAEPVPTVWSEAYAEPSGNTI